MSSDTFDKARKEINEIDKEMAELFVRRMSAVERVAKYKKEHGLAVLDEAREREIIEKNSLFVKDEAIRDCYIDFLKNTMSISRNYQQMLMEKEEK